VAEPTSRISIMRITEQATQTPLPADLLATKLVPPVPRADLVARPRLLRRLDEALGRRLALLSAPPGSGKSTLLGEWLARQQCSAQPCAIAWVGLDEGDDDSMRFWLTVASALERALPGSTGATLALLRAPQQPPTRGILTTLLNALSAAPGTLLLVLDDYHAIAEQSIHEALGQLIDSLPAHVHLILASRTDPPLPLARLRARGELVEVHAADLRFSVVEAASFLSQVMGQRLTPEQVALLESRTEGWIAGLQLAALSLRGQRDVTAFLESFAGSHRYIVDYLADEVLNRQPERIRAFLTRTSLLSELCASLCDAVTGERDSQTLLAHLERAHLFLIPLDSERRWYRYHALFAEALRQRLRETYAGEVARLHVSASAWFEREGILREAVAHALAAGDTRRAATLVERAAEGYWKRSEVAALRLLLDVLPDNVVRTRPKLCLLHA